jgi:hypothetical protein
VDFVLPKTAIKVIINVLVVCMARDVTLLMRENPFQWPKYWICPHHYH